MVFFTRCISPCTVEALLPNVLYHPSTLALLDKIHIQDAVNIEEHGSKQEQCIKENFSLEFNYNLG